MKGKKFQCPHCDRFIAWHECTSNGRPTEPEPGDCGVCSACGLWWEMNAGRLLIKYRPTKAEQMMILAYITRE